MTELHPSSRRKLAALVGALVLFFLSVQAIRAGATVPSFLLDRLVEPSRGLGVAWLGAYLALAGSPVAALAVTLHAEGEIGAAVTYAMIAGSRLGAEAIVLITGALALLRGRRAPERRAADKRGIEVGFLAFLVSLTVYVPATLLGLAILSFWTPSVSVPGAGPLTGLTDLTTRPLVDAIVGVVGAGWTTLLGIAGLWTAFRVFERNLPTPRTAGPLARTARRMLLRPSLAFLLGAAVTAVVTTVAISLTLLVPLHMRGVLNRGQMAAYMLGAGVTTLVDTWFAAAVNGDPVGQGIVLLLMGLVALLSGLCLVFFRPVVGAWNRVLDAVTASPLRMLAAGIALVAAPIGLVFL